MIGIFDSGLGGLAVTKAIRSQCPNTPIVYVADTANSPYGEQSKSYVIERSQCIANSLIQQGTRLIVVACNTATSLAIPRLRQTTTLPIIGVEPAIKPAAQLSVTRQILVLVTPAMAESQGLKALVKRFENQCRIHIVPMLGLADAIDRNDQQAIDRLILHLKQSDDLNMSNIFNNVDVCVLGCTHYPLITNKLAPVLGAHVHMIDNAQAIATRVEALLVEQETPVSDRRVSNSRVSIQVTGQPESFKAAIAQYPELQLFSSLNISHVTL